MLSDEPAPRTLWRDAWARLRRHRLNFLYAAIIVIYVLIALSACVPPLGEQWWKSESARQLPLYEKVFGGSYDPPKFGACVSLWLGTDIAGRSVLWRLLYGTRIALTVAILSSI